VTLAGNLLVFLDSSDSGTSGPPGVRPPAGSPSTQSACHAKQRSGKVQGFPVVSVAMDLKFLEFEQPIAELEARIDALKFVGEDSELNISEEISRLRNKSESLTRSIFSSLTAWQIAQLARHPQRPYALDYVDKCFTDFQELHGDRMYADDHSLVGGLARLDNEPVVVLGHQKGRDTKERVWRNYGMARPEGYRKGLRLMNLAEKFGLPLITLIDTPGAYPGIGAEERGQAEAIARNLFVMSSLKVPIISVVIGEGGSGGALAIGVADRVLMLQYAIYSVISPEGCASILWKSADKAELAAEAMGITAERLLRLKLVDDVIPEPLGGAHRDPQTMAEALKQSLTQTLASLQGIPLDALLVQRRKRLASYGVFKES
jgi:acetyl-CoA carboxylase carboxyl transferase subunit alpha